MIKWASKPNEEGMAKVCLRMNIDGCTGESFWVRSCKDNGKGGYEGIVDNNLIGTDSHGYTLGDIIEFEEKES